jgi:hypothetical protein
MTAGTFVAARALRWSPLRQWVLPRSSADWARVDVGGARRRLALTSRIENMLVSAFR